VPVESMTWEFSIHPYAPFSAPMIANEESATARMKSIDRWLVVEGRRRKTRSTPREATVVNLAGIGRAKNWISLPRIVLYAPVASFVMSANGSYTR
jgi:hypothetical protein